MTNKVFTIVRKDGKIYFKSADKGMQFLHIAPITPYGSNTYWSFRNLKFYNKENVEMKVTSYKTVSDYKATFVLDGKINATVEAKANSVFLFSKAYSAIKNIGKYTELFETDFKKIGSLSTKDFTKRLKNDIEVYEELAELQEIAYKATNGLLYDDEYMKYFNVREGQKGYLSKAQSIHDNAFEILDQAPNYISGLYYEIFRLKALKNLSKEQDEELKKALKQVNLDAILDLAGLQNYKLMATKIKTALNALIRAKKVID